MSNKKLLLIGGGGHCKSILGSLFFMEQYDEICIIGKNKESVGKSILSMPIIGCDNDLFDLYKKGYEYAFVALGSIGNSEVRNKLFFELKRIGFIIPNIIDSTSIISKQVKLGEGIYVGKNVVINIGSSIGKGAIINTSSTIEHDCSVGDFSHVAPGAVLCGEVNVGSHSHIGAGSVIKQQIKIGDNVMIGMGSVVLNDISKNMIAFGNPCKEIKPR